MRRFRESVLARVQKVFASNPRKRTAVLGNGQDTPWQDRDKTLPIELKRLGLASSEKQIYSVAGEQRQHVQSILTIGGCKFSILALSPGEA
jgi:hypothetical protein